MMIYIKKHIRLFTVLLAVILVASVPVSRVFSAYSADSDSRSLDSSMYRVVR